MSLTGDEFERTIDLRASQAEERESWTATVDRCRMPAWLAMTWFIGLAVGALACAGLLIGNPGNQRVMEAVAVFILLITVPAVIFARWRRETGFLNIIRIHAPDVFSRMIEEGIVSRSTRDRLAEKSRRGKSRSG